MTTHPRRRRLDSELVRRGLAPSRQRARADIAAGRVLVGGARAERAGRLVSPAEPLRLTGPGPRFVSRGGDKLEAALDRFEVDPDGRVALDAGASTGGFTDCLLQRGAVRVVAVDVGRGQLDAGLRADERVVVREQTNVRHLTPADLGGERFPIVVADLSFISLRTVAPALLGLAAAGADLVLLVKPQFEVGRAAASRGRGVVGDPGLWAACLQATLAAYREGGAAIMGLMPSPVRGRSGNVEFLAHLRAPGAAVTGPGPALDHLVAAAVAEAIATAGGPDR